MRTVPLGQSSPLPNVPAKPSARRAQTRSVNLHSYTVSHERKVVLRSITLSAGICKPTTRSPDAKPLNAFATFATLPKFRAQRFAARRVRASGKLFKGRFRRSRCGHEQNLSHAYSRQALLLGAHIHAPINQPPSSSKVLRPFAFNRSFNSNVDVLP